MPSRCITALATLVIPVSLSLCSWMKTISAEMRQSWGMIPLAPSNVDRDDADGSLFELGEPFPGVGPDRAGGRGRPGNGHGKVGSVQLFTASYGTAVGPSRAGLGEARAIPDAGWLSLGAAQRMMPLGGIVPGNQNIIVVG